MALSRPVLLALVGVLLATATLFAARGARETAADPAPSPVNAQSAVPVTPAPVGEGRSSSRPDAGTRETGKAREDAPRAEQTAPDGPAKPANKGDRRDLPARESGPTAKLDVPAGVPRPVGRALARKRVVVLFFGQQGADDRATSEAVASVRGQKGVSVFRDDIQRLAKYRAVTSGLNVAQAPATVVIGPDRQAQLLEGFTDEGTLRQLVVDAR